MTDALEKTQAGLVPVPWMQDAQMQAYQGVLGAEKDRLVDRARLGVKLRWPGGPAMQAAQQGLELTNEPVPSAADNGDKLRLRMMGQGFALPRMGSMTDEQYEAYLETAWSVWGLGGTQQAIVDALHAYGIPDVEIVEEWQDPWGPLASPRGCPYGHRFSVILGPNYGAFTWAPMGFPIPLTTPTAVLGIANMQQQQLTDIARLLRLWKDAGALPIKVCFRFTVNGVTSPVFGLGGIPFPIPLVAAPPAIEFMLTENMWGESLDSAGRDEGLEFPIRLGPFYPFGPGQ